MALFKGSRYEAVPEFLPDDAGRVVFRGLRPRALGPSEAVLEHLVAVKERLDGLGYNYYSRPADWYRVAEANPDYLFAEDMLVRWPDVLPEPDDNQAGMGGESGERLGATILIPRRGNEA